MFGRRVVVPLLGAGLIASGVGGKLAGDQINNITGGPDPNLTLGSGADCRDGVHRADLGPDDTYRVQVRGIGGLVLRTSSSQPDTLGITGDDRFGLDDVTQPDLSRLTNLAKNALRLGDDGKAIGPDEQIDFTVRGRGGQGDYAFTIASRPGTHQPTFSMTCPPPLPPPTTTG